MVRAGCLGLESIDHEFVPGQYRDLGPYARRGGSHFLGNVEPGYRYLSRVILVHIGVELRLGVGQQLVWGNPWFDGATIGLRGLLPIKPEVAN